MRAKPLISRATPQVSFQVYLLTMTLALSAGPLLLLGFYHFQSTYRAVKVQAFQRDQQLTRSFSKELSARLESRVEVVKSLAASATYLLRDLDPQRLSAAPRAAWPARDQAKLKTLQNIVDEVRGRSQYFDFMYVARRAGDSLAISPLYSPSGESYLGANYSDRDYFRSLVASERVAISQVQLGKRSRRPNIQIVAPIFSEEGSLIGLSEGSVDLKIINEASSELIALDDSLSERKGRLLVLDHFDQILVDSFGESAQLSKFRVSTRARQAGGAQGSTKLKDEGIPRRAQEGESAQREVLFDQTSWMMSEDQIKTEGGLEWRVILLRDEAELKSNAQLSALKALIPIVLLMLLIVSLGLRLTRRLSRDVTALGEALDEIERDGEFESILSVYPSLKMREWIELFDHAHHFGVTLKTNRETIASALEAERLLNERQRSLLMALEFSHEGIEITDASGEILYQNSQAERLSLLKRPAPMVSAYWHQRSDLESPQDMVVKSERFSEGLTWSGMLMGSREGEERVSEVTLSPQRDQGELTRVIVTLRDVTEEHHRREALKTSERLASVGSLASGIAHEVNNPLMYILANVDFALEDLKRGALSVEELGEVVSSLEQVKTGAEQVKDVSRSLLSISRQERELEWCSVSESVERCLRLVRAEVNHQSELMIKIESDGYFFGSLSDLSQVLMNLIHNALHAMQETRHERPPKLLVRVSERAQPQHAQSRVVGSTDIKARDTRAVIEVTDNGPGISEELVTRIFDPFFTTKERGIGTGLGLSICQRIIHELGGELSVRSTLGEGSSFELSIPIVRERPGGAIQYHTSPVPTLYAKRPDRVDAPCETQSEQDKQDKQDKQGIQGVQNKQDTPRVLIVDDVQAITEMLCRQLKNKFIVEGVNSGAEALSKLSDGEFDLILSDVMMPNMSGVELYHEAVGQRPDLARRFLFMTGGVLDDNDQRFFDQDEVTCLAKPVARKVLINAIKTQLKALRSEEPN